MKSNNNNNKNKLNLFIDFDNTIVDTTDAAVKIYNNYFNTNINSLDIENYSMEPFISLNEKERSDLFCKDSLYEILKPFDNVHNILKNLRDSNLFNKIYLVTNCSAKSIPHKIKWLKDNNFDNLFDGKLYLDVNQGYNKSMINMSNSILIDDHRENHLTSNAKYKLSFQYDKRKQNWGPEPQDGVIVFRKWDNGIYYYLEHIAKSYSGKYAKS